MPTNSGRKGRLIAVLCCSKEALVIRNYDVTPQLPSNGLTVVETFAGGGLMAVGLKAAGYNIVWANDFDKSACRSYAANIGQHIIHGDITLIDIDSIPDADIIAGGPPCQDFSVAGNGEGEDGERGRLVWTYLNVIRRKQPKAFVFENVKGLIQRKHRHTFDALLAQFDEIGYNVSWRLVNAWDYGVAQKRERVFIVGVRKDVGFTFVFPEPSPDDYRTQVLRDVIGDLPEPSNSGLSDKAIEGARRRKASGSSHVTLAEQKWDEPCCTITAQLAKDPTKIIPPMNHDPLPLSERVAERLETDGYGDYLRKHPIDVMDEPARSVRAQFAKGAPNRMFYPDNHVKKEISEEAMDGYARRGGQGGFAFRVNDWEEPSPTIFGRIFNEGKAFVHPSYADNHVGYGIRKDEIPFVDKIPPGGNWRNLTEDEQQEFMGGGFRNGGGNSGYLRRSEDASPAHTIDTTPLAKSTCQLHPTQPRRFTVRECLRIQSVPDAYVIPDEISLSAQYRIVGNGVASRVSYLIGVALAEQLSAALALKDGEAVAI